MNTVHGITAHEALKSYRGMAPATRQTIYRELRNGAYEGQLTVVGGRYIVIETEFHNWLRRHRFPQPGRPSLRH